MYGDKELRERRDEKIGGVENSYSAIKLCRDADTPYTTALRGLSFDAVEIGSCELHLRNVESGREWFARAALADRSYLHLFVTRWDELSTSTQARGGIRALSAIVNALVAGDHRLIETVAQQVLTLSDDYPNEYAGTGEYYWKACTIASLVEDDITTAREYLEDYIALLEEGDFGGHSKGLVQTERGLVDDDTEQVLQGIHQMLDHHDANLDDLPSRLELMSPTTAAHLLLARDRGMDIDVDSEYLPDALDEYGIDGEIDLPRPDYLREELIVGE